MTTILDELAELVWSRPALDATAAEQAAWYERKAVMLDHTAAMGGLDPLVAARWARDARRHAAHLVDPPARRDAYADASNARVAALLARYRDGAA